MYDPGLNLHEWESEMAALEDDLRDDPAAALPELDSLLARMLQRDGWINADCQRLLLSSEPVSETPQLAAVRLDQQMKPTAIRELHWPIA